MSAEKKIKEIYVFGAGASYASDGAPLGKDLVWKYYEDCSDLYRIENGKPAEDDLIEKRIEFENYEKFLLLADDIFPGLDANSKWHKRMLEGAVYDFPAQLGKKYYVDEMAKLLQLKGNVEGIELLRQLALEHIGGATLDGHNLLYERFIKSLIGKSPGEVSIISFNFDCLLHEDFKNEVYFDYLISFNAIDEHRSSYNKQNGIPLIKLNGSLDWAFCKKCSKIKLLFPFVGKRSYNKLLCKMTQGCDCELKPLIFLPHEEKKYLIHLLWSKAREDLQKALRIIVVGYSFPYYDTDVIKLFQESMDSDVEMVIVDYAENEAEKITAESNFERIKNIFSCRNNMRLFLNGFQGYV